MDTPLGLVTGAGGGVVAAITGVGVDMMLYAALGLFYRTELKVAPPASVALMAFTSVIGAAANLALSVGFSGVYALQPDLVRRWIAPAPVVALGAPLGAIIVARPPRPPTRLLVSTLRTAQLV